MSLWQAFFLGIVQGITEFLPISSSGHLALAQHLFGFEHLQDYILFNLVCHLGTLATIFYFFYPAIREGLNIHKPRFWQIIVGTLPLFPLVLILKPIKSVFNSPELLGPCFLVSASFLFASIYYRPSFTLGKSSRWTGPLIVGFCQAVAILPGISRSGTTISAGKLLGWTKEQAIQFSFLLAIPAILGGTVLEGWQVWSNPTETFLNQNPWVFATGFLTSCLIGYLSLWILIRLVIQDKWYYFAWYCLVLGTVTTIYNLI